MSDWKDSNGRLVRTFHFASFADAMIFMPRCGFEAEAMNHLPEWTNVHNRVTVSLTTHDAGNVVTEKDRELARRMDAIHAACKRPEN